MVVPDTAIKVLLLWVAHPLLWLRVSPFSDRVSEGSCTHPDRSRGAGDRRVPTRADDGPPGSEWSCDRYPWTYQTTRTLSPYETFVFTE